MTAVTTKIQLRKGTLAEWNEADPELLYGEVAIVYDEGILKLKVGNENNDKFSDLPFYNPGAASMPDATSEIKGVLKLTGDLGGTAEAPTVPNKVDKVSGKSLIADAEISRLASMTAIFTTALKAVYDSASSWVTTNGTNVLNHLSNTSNPHSVTKSQVGLGNVDNTSDANKPISTATQTALDSLKTATISFIIDGGGSAITTGIKGDLEIPFPCTINEVTMLADQTGSIVVDVWKNTYASYPPTVANTITASAKPTITTAVKSKDSTLTG